MTTTHFIAYQNTDEFGPYNRNAADRSATERGFNTTKNFRHETLEGQRLWIFEGTGNPRRYSLVSSGTITRFKKRKRPSWDTTASEVRFEVDAGRQPIDVTNFPWLQKLLQQRTFSHGINSTKDASVIRSLEKLVSGRSGATNQSATAANDIEKIRRDPKVRDETTRKALIYARLGMGEFRSGLQRRWGNRCAVTGCTILDVLRASHIKPWSMSNNRERLNPANGILLAAHIDALFDRGLISFSDSGGMLLSDRIGAKDRKTFRLPAKLRLKLSASEKRFLNHHRKRFDY